MTNILYHVLMLNSLISIFNQKSSSFIPFMLDQYYFSIDIQHSITFHFIYFLLLHLFCETMKFPVDILFLEKFK